MSQQLKTMTKGFLKQHHYALMSQRINLMEDRKHLEPVINHSELMIHIKT